MILLGGGALFALGLSLGLLATGPAEDDSPDAAASAAGEVLAAESGVARGRELGPSAGGTARAEAGLRPAARPALEAEAGKRSGAAQRAALAGPDPRWSELRHEVEAAIAVAIGEASKRSGGKVSGANSAVAVHVRSLARSDGELAIQEQLALRPASVLKLVTCATMLVELGADAHFATAFELRGRIEDDHVLRGDLIARAGGDPIWGGDEPQLAIERFAAELAAKLRAVGIEQIDGALLLDEGSFADPGPGPAWPASREYWKEYCALAAGFTVNAGCLTAVVRTGRSGSSASSELWPRGYGLQRRGSVVTGPRGSQLDVAIGATATSATLRGTVPEGLGTWRARCAHPRPVEYFGEALCAALAADGLRISGGARRERELPRGQAIGVVRSSMKELLGPILEESNNALADQLFLAVGLQVAGAGSRAAAASVTRAALDALAVPTQGFVQVDGSGLSRDDRLSASQITGLLAAVERLGGETARTFEESLALAGESGTLSKRMRTGPAHGRVRAKTGFIDGTSALAGYARSLAGEPFCFAILVSYPHRDGLNMHCFKPLGDRICEAIVELPAGR